MPTARTTANGVPIPVGWTDEPAIVSSSGLPVDAESSDPNNNPTAEFFKEQGLSLPVSPVFTREPATGDDVSLFKSGDSHYVWNGMAFSLCKITQPTDIQSIATAMRDKGGLGALKLQEMP